MILLVAGIAVALALLARGGASSDVSGKKGTNPNTPATDNTVGDTVKTGLAVVTTVTPLVATIAAAFPTTAAGAGAAAASGGAAGAASGAASSGTAVGSSAGVDAAAVGTEGLGVVLAEVTGVLIVVVWVGLVFAILQGVFEDASRAAKRASEGAWRWLRFRIEDTERDLLEQIIVKLGGTFTRRFDNSELAWPIYRIDTVSGLDSGKLAAAICIARYAAVEQVRAFNAGVREVFKTQTGTQDAGPVNAGYALTDAVFDLLVADFYAANAGATSFGTALRIEYQAPSGRTARRARLWSDDNALLASTDVQAFNEFVGQLAAIRYAFDNLHESIFPDANPPTAGNLWSYALNVRRAFGWDYGPQGVVQTQGDFLIHTGCHRACHPKSMRDYGGSAQFNVNAQGLVEGGLMTVLGGRNTN